ncbi:MAG: hypothetical protein F4Z28_05065 [Gammaproteobacteria bacterium]|nr:hypothetical protein [Gammaproteobacteria bacterium]
MSRKLLRIDLETPLAGEWFDIEKRLFAPRNRKPLLELMKRGLEAGDRQKGDDVDPIDALVIDSEYEEECMEFIGKLVVNASEFFEEPYLESFQDLWGPEGSAVRRAFFGGFTGGSQTKKPSSDQSSAATEDSPE